MFWGSSTSSWIGCSSSPSYSSSEESSSHIGMGDKGGIPARLISSSLFSPKSGSSVWVKVGANASPKTDQKCKLGSLIIRRLSFSVAPQE
jgi:hypothetical protein